MLKIILLVGAGGFLGSITRYLIGYGIFKILPVAFPMGTLFINVLGCLILGMIIGLSNKEIISVEWRFFLATGFCGGFTTFSTFAYESLHLYLNKDYGYFLLYAILSYVLGLCAAWCGFIITK